MIYELLSKLSDQGIKVKLNHEDLAVDAPKGILTNDLIGEIKKHKTPLIDYLKKKKERSAVLKKSEKKEYYTLSAAQKRMFFINELDRSNLSYNMINITPVSDQFDARQVEEIMARIIERHECLRTSFKVMAGVPSQFVHEKVDFKIQKIDSGNSDLSEVVNTLVQPFDLSQPPLMRAYLIGGCGQQQLLVDTHHIITDGVSQDIIMREFNSLYNGKKLNSLGFQYKDYAEFQSSASYKKGLGQMKAYWLHELSVPFAQLDLPLDKPRPATRTYEGRSVRFCFDQDETRELRKIADEENVTMFMLMLSAFNVLLSKLTGQEDIIIGVPFSGRQLSDINSLVGMFVNTLPVRSNTAGDLAFDTFLQNTKSKCLEIFENQEYQFDELVADLKVERDVNRNPVYDVAFEFFDRREARMVIPDSSNYTDREHGRGYGTFDIFLNVNDCGNTIDIDFDYSVHLFEPVTIDRYIRYFKKVIADIRINRKQRIKDLSLLSKEEEHALLFGFNDTKVPYPSHKTIIDLFDDQVLLAPEKVAVAEGDARVTYGELSRRANGIARLLQREKVEEGECVAILANRSVDAVVAMVGILKAGAAYLPLDPDSPKDRLAYVIADSKAKVILAQGKYTSVVSGNIINIDLNDIDRNAETSNFKRAHTAADLAYVMYTSGSTGQPKGVAITHRNVVRLVKSADYVSLDGSTRILQTGAPAFDANTFEIWGALLNGGTLCIADNAVLLDTRLLRKAIREYQINTIFITTALFNKHAKEDAALFSSLQYLLVGGESLNPQFINLVKSKSPNLHLKNIYGPTENTTFSVCHEIVKHYASNIPIGKPINNSTAYVFSKNLTLQPVGVIGEIWVGGDGVAKGYINNEALNREKFMEHPYIQGERIYRTGDLARWLPDGNMEFQGRVDTQVKIRGFRVELGEIESKLNSHEQIKESVVLVRNSDGDKSLVAYYVSAHTIDARQLRTFLSEQLPDYMIPVHYLRLDKMPLNLNGKIDKNALPAPEISFEGEFIGPSNSIERKLVKLWSEILNINEAVISVTSNFFEMGGHSLRATILGSRIHKTFKIKIALKDIFQLQTIRAQAEHISGAVKGSYFAIVPVEKKEYYPLSSAQKRLFFLQRLNLQSTSYNIPTVLTLAHDVSVGKLENAFQLLVNRHESFRTNFITIDNQIVQRIRKDVEFKVDILSADESGLDLTINSYIRPFDLEKDILLRACIIEVARRYFVLIVDMHHIIADGTTSTIVQEDFMSLLNGHALPLLKYQYKDFSHWQNALMARGDIAKQERYWRELYAGEIPRLNILTDYRRPEVFTFKGDHHEFVLEGSEADQFRALGARCGATLYMSMLAVLNALYYKYTGQEDIIIGTGIAGRPHADLQNITGMFVNTLAMRNKPSGEVCFADFLGEVSKTCVSAFENQDVQFEDLVEKLNVDRDPSRNPMFDVCMVVQNFKGYNVQVSSASLQEPGTHQQPLYRNTTAKFDMTFFVYEGVDRISIDIEYYSEIFKPETIERLASHFRNVVKAVISDQQIKLKDINILSAGEARQILGDFNDTYVSYPGDETIHELFETQVAANPDHIALRFQSQSMTYGMLNKQANQLARYLQNTCKIGRDELVGIYQDRSADQVISILAVLKAGGAYIPLDVSLPEQRVQTIIEDSGLRVLISHKRLVRELNRLQWRCENLRHYICPDTHNIHRESEETVNELMDHKLWDYVAKTATDEITAGGWTSSYTGLPLSKREMDEYGDNVLEKVRPLLTKQSRVLEIGCASGISMYRIAPHVKLYYGTDLSSVTIENNKTRIQAEGHNNIMLKHCAAHNIDEIEESGFDLIIVNSVIQAFHGHSYLRKVIGQCIALLGDHGHLFIGDVMDEALRKDLIKSLEDFKKDHQHTSSYTTKTDLSSELFVSRNYFSDLQADIADIAAVEFSPKIHTIENELTRYRYDTLLHIDKNAGRKRARQQATSRKMKYQHDASCLTQYYTSNLESGSTPGDLAYVIYTSGTTGTPKGVMIEHKGVVNLAKGQADALRLKPDTKTLQFASIGFDASCYEIFNTLLSGGTLVIPRKEDLLSPENFENLITENQVGLVTLPPSYQHMVKNHMAAVHTVVSAGEAMNPDDGRYLQSLNIRLINAYGPTENTVCTSLTDSPIWEDGRITIGKPIANVHVYICDKDMNLCPIGVAGEMYIGGANLGRGYLNREALTEKAFIVNALNGNGSERIYRSGDLGRWLPDGNIEYLGRIDDQVKIRGNRMELGEIENQLKLCDQVADAVVVAKQKGEEKYLVAYYVSETAVDASALRTYLGDRLPDYMVPAHFVRVEAIPLTASGKVNKKALPDPEIKTREKYVAPCSDIEKDLVALWQELLGAEAVGINDNFFELGGNSLSGVRLVTAIKKKLGVEVPVGVLFKLNTIMLLAQWIDENHADTADVNEHYEEIRL